MKAATPALLLVAAAAVGEDVPSRPAAAAPGASLSAPTVTPRAASSTGTVSSKAGTSPWDTGSGGTSRAANAGCTMAMLLAEFAALAALNGCLAQRFRRASEVAAAMIFELKRTIHTMTVT